MLLWAGMFVVLGGLLWLTVLAFRSVDLPRVAEHLAESASAAEEIVALHEELFEKPSVPIPEEVRGIYWTATTAGSERGQELLRYMKQTGLNAAVIDLQMDNGQLAYQPENEELDRYVMKNPAVKDFEALLDQLHEEGIYRIARIAVMRNGAFAVQNPEFALRWPGGSMWQDSIGSLWVDPDAPEVADYVTALAIEAYEMGFDEVQFDYVRFASDGKISSIRYPVFKDKTKVRAMQEFFWDIARGLYAYDPEVVWSYDVFGMTFENTYDFNIGQRLQDAWPYADYISPMVYPSHYADGFNGFANPALHPYPIVKGSLDKGAKILEEVYGIGEKHTRPTFRPWLQDFDIGAVYTAARIEAQIQAARDAGASGWILWNARNVYEPANYLPAE